MQTLLKSILLLFLAVHDRHVTSVLSQIKVRILYMYWINYYLIIVFSILMYH